MHIVAGMLANSSAFSMDKKQVSDEECMYQSLFNIVELCRINVS